MSELQFLTDGPADARDRLVLAHGAGAPMDHPAMEAIATGVATAGIRVFRFEFPYMRQRRDRRQPAASRPASRATPDLARGHRRLGRSRGPRDRRTLDGRPHGQPHRRRGGRPGSHMPGLPVPSAGKTREPPHAAPGRPVHAHAHRSGRARRLWIPSRGRTYDLSDAIRIHWLVDGDHSFVPRKASGRTAAQHLAEASAVTAEFIQALDHATPG